MSRPRAGAREAARALNELSYLFCEEDNTAYDEVLESYFLSADQNEEDSEDDECKHALLAKPITISSKPRLNKIK